MRRRIIILIGGVTSSGDDERIKQLTKSGGTARWGSRMKDLSPGDTVFIYIGRPQSQLTAKAKVLGKPEKGESGDYRYRVKLGNFELLPNQVGIDDLRKSFPTWTGLRHLQAALVVPEACADKLWKLVHDKQSTVQILISNAGYGLRQIEQQAASTNSRYWSVPKNTSRGDTAFFYVESPVQQIVAMGKVLSRPRPTSKKWHEAKIGTVERLAQPLSLSQLRAEFPDWPWLRGMTMFSYVNPLRAKRLLTLAGQAKVTARALGKAPATENGGGWSNDHDRNLKVQKAAERHVTRFYRSKGFTVCLMPPNNPGYDLLVERKQVKLRIEVKGISGNKPSFLITHRERREATRIDWRLAIVTLALTRQRQHRVLNGKNFSRQFCFQPIQYMASQK